MNPQTTQALQSATRYLQKRATEAEDHGLCWTVERGTHVNDHAAAEAAGCSEAARLILSLIP